MWISVAALNLAVAVMLGAFGAHGLKAKVTSGQISAEQLGWWSTATEYFFYHALGMLLVAILLKLELLNITASAWLLQVGIILFCGSLYAMTLGAPRWFGAITPIGGLCFIAAWLWLAYKAMSING